MVNDPDDGPPTIVGIEQWRNEYGLDNIYVAADTTVSMAVNGSIGTPTATIIDPRTMTVYSREPGSSGFTTAEELANMNKVQ